MLLACHLILAFLVLNLYEKALAHPMPEKLNFRQTSSSASRLVFCSLDLLMFVLISQAYFRVVSAYASPAKVNAPTSCRENGFQDADPLGLCGFLILHAQLCSHVPCRLHCCRVVSHGRHQSDFLAGSKCARRFDKPGIGLSILQCTPCWCIFATSGRS